MVRVACRATSPDPRKRNAVCGSILGDIPAGYAFVGTAARHSHAPDNRLWIRCSRRDCRVINVFAPEERG
jgi:hypothetical protein